MQPLQKGVYLGADGKKYTVLEVGDEPLIVDQAGGRVKPGPEKEAILKRMASGDLQLSRPGIVEDSFLSRIETGELEKNDKTKAAAETAWQKLAAQKAEPQPGSVEHVVKKNMRGPGEGTFMDNSADWRGLFEFYPEEGKAEMVRAVKAELGK